MALEKIQTAIQEIFSGLARQLPTALTGAASMILSVIMAVLAVWVVVRCGRSLLRGRLESEVWARLVEPGGEIIPVLHWENTLGRSRRCDIVLPAPTISRNHAALIRDSAGQWFLYALNAKNGVTLGGETLEVNQQRELRPGDELGLGGLTLTFQPISREEERCQAQRRTKPGRASSQGCTLLLLTLFQLVLFCQLAIGLRDSDTSLLPVGVAFGGVCALMWLMYALYRSFGRRGFELETLAFFLTTLCMEVTASSAPTSLYKQLLTVVLGLMLFFVLTLLLRNLKLAKKARWPVAILAGGLLVFNLLFGQTLFGAKNWVDLGFISFQPSELVKLAFILVGATTLDRMFTRRNLIFTLLFAGLCVGCLALMSDFGTALIFFMAFLAIAFLRSGDLPSVAFMGSAAVFAGFIILKFKPYIANRFLVYRHVWEDTSGYGYQQVRTMSAIASGGLLGNGAGSGWLKNVGAANTDLVFGMLGEELGLIIAVTAVATIVIFALAAVKFSAAGRSSFYVIAACSTAMLLVVQTMLNVFGSTDLLPLTGVTFPFVSCGGSSMLACWGLLAYIKAADTRQNAGLAVPLPRNFRKRKTARPAPPKKPDPQSQLPQEGELDPDAWRKHFDWGEDEP